MKFLVDMPLGGLAKWLRLCGFDTSLTRLDPAAPQALPSPAPKTLLVSNRNALSRLQRPDVLILAANEPQAQLEELLHRLRLSPEQLKPLSRCSHCNVLLAPAEPSRVQGRVPDHVLQVQNRFFECPRCHRIFWPGSHVQTILATLQETLRTPGEASSETAET